MPIGAFSSTFRHFGVVDRTPSITMWTLHDHHFHCTYHNRDDQDPCNQDWQNTFVGTSVQIELEDEDHQLRVGHMCG